MPDFIFGCLVECSHVSCCCIRLLSFSKLELQTLDIVSSDVTVSTGTLYCKQNTLHTDSTPALAPAK